MLSERLFVEVNGKARVAHGHLLEISIAVAVDDPLMPSERTTSIPLRSVGNPHVQQAALRFAFAGAPSGAIQYGALFGKSIWLCTTPRTTGRRSINEFGDHQRIALLTFTEEKAGHAIPEASISVSGKADERRASYNALLRRRQCPLIGRLRI